MPITYDIPLLTTYTTHLLENLHLPRPSVLAFLQAHPSFAAVVARMGAREFDLLLRRLRDVCEPRHSMVRRGRISTELRGAVEEEWNDWVRWEQGPWTGSEGAVDEWDVGSTVAGSEWGDRSVLGEWKAERERGRDKLADTEAWAWSQGSSRSGRSRRSRRSERWGGSQASSCASSTSSWGGSSIASSRRSQFSWA